jgi:Cys-tRNA(Pro)/Cys-tRNA(Cys) deacylase
MAKTRTKASGGTPAVRALEQIGAAFKLHAYDFESVPGEIGLQAARELGVEPARVLKTLMAVLDDRELVAALVPADLECDLKALAKAAGGKRAAMAKLDQAERATGYVKGGISPFGQKKAHRSFVDASAQGQESVFVNGGQRGLQIELTPADLVRLLDATVAPLAKG